MFHKPVVRSVLEYVCIVRHHRLTVAQTKRLETLQKRISLTYDEVHGMPYILALSLSH